MSTDAERIAEQLARKSELVGHLQRNKAKKAGIATVTARLFNEVNALKDKSKQLGYFFTMPKINYNYG